MAKAGSAVGGPKVRRLADKLRREVLVRRRPGERLDSERDLARVHGCAVRTVRGALALLARQGLVERIHGSGTYVSDQAAAASRTTGLLFFSTAPTLLAASFYRDTLLGLLDGTTGSDQQVHMILGRRTGPAEITSSFISELELERFNSVVCLEVFNHDLLERVAERRAVVSVDFACHRPGVSSCALDHAQTIELAVAHLWALGHRRIGYADDLKRGTTDPARSQRLAAYHAAMDRRAAPVRPEWLLPVANLPDAFLTAETWARLDPRRRPTALLCTDYAWELAHALAVRGVRIPADVSLLCIGRPFAAWIDWVEAINARAEANGSAGPAAGTPVDPLDGAAAALRPMLLTHVRLPFREMGAWAMAELLRRVSEPAARPRFETFTGAIVAGNTIGPPSGA